MSDFHTKKIPTNPGSVSAPPAPTVATPTNERDAFEKWMIEEAKIIIGSTDPYPAGLERDYWKVWQAARATTLEEQKPVAYSLHNSKGITVSWSVTKDILESDIKTYYKDQGYYIQPLYAKPTTALVARNLGRNGRKRISEEIKDREAIDPQFKQDMADARNILANDLCPLVARNEALEEAANFADVAYDSLDEPRNGWDLKDSTQAQYSGFQEAAKEIAQNIRALKAGDVPKGDGWQWVPVEPTAEMMAAGRTSGSHTFNADAIYEVFKAMLSASPKKEG